MGRVGSCALVCEKTVRIHLIHVISFIDESVLNREANASHSHLSLNVLVSLDHSNLVQTKAVATNSFFFCIQYRIAGNFQGRKLS